MRSNAAKWIAKCVLSAAALVMAATCASSKGRVGREPEKLSSIDITSDFYVTGGYFAKAGQIPWQVSLRVRKTSAVYLCGGSVIKPGWIVTAAHCLEDDRAPGAADVKPAIVPVTSIDVRSGSLYVGYGGLEAEPTGLWIMKERDASSNSYDIALLRVQISEKAVPIDLDKASTIIGAETLSPGRKLLVSGYGKTEDGTQAPALKYVDVEYVGRRACNAAQSHHGLVLSNMICAGGKAGKDSCTGDSGGPLFLAAEGAANKRPLLVGLVSWGSKSGCAIADFPGVYTQVSDPTIASWIEKTLKINSA